MQWLHGSHLPTACRSKLLQHVIAKLWRYGTAPDSELAREMERTVHEKLCTLYEQRGGTAGRL